MRSHNSSPFFGSAGRGECVERSYIRACRILMLGCAGTRIINTILNVYFVPYSKYKFGNAAYKELASSQFLFCFVGKVIFI